MDIQALEIILFLMWPTGREKNLKTRPYMGIFYAHSWKLLPSTQSITGGTTSFGIAWFASNVRTESGDLVDPVLVHGSWGQGYI